MMRHDTPPSDQLAARIFGELGHRKDYDVPRMAAFGRWLQGYRETVGWTQVQLGHALGIGDQSVRKAEFGQLRWRRERYARLFALWSVIDYTWEPAGNGWAFIPQFADLPPEPAPAPKEALAEDERLMLDLYRALGDRDRAVLRAMAGVLSAAR